MKEPRYSYSQHVENLSKLLNYYGGAVDPQYGYLLITGKNYKPGMNGYLIGQVNLSKKENYNGQFVGKTAITSIQWRNSYDSSLTTNLKLNMLLEANKYFLGSKAGEDLWSLFDYKYVTGRLDAKSFNFTIR